jgi:hypothetical protein
VVEEEVLHIVEEVDIIKVEVDHKIQVVKCMFQDKVSKINSMLIHIMMNTMVKNNTIKKLKINNIIKKVMDRLINSSSSSNINQNINKSKMYKKKHKITEKFN